MKKILNIGKEILFGVGIGVANVIPGFSGGTMAVIFKVYERIIGAFSEFFKHPIKVIKDIWAIILGLIIGIVLSVFAIVKLLETYPIPTVMFFVGLIIGSIPFIYLESKDNKKISYKEIIALIIAIGVLVALPLLKTNEIMVSNINFGVIALVFIMGVIAAATMIVPGVSGSLILMVFGYYFYIVGTIKDLLKSVLTFTFDNFGNNFIITLSFGIGAVIGIVFISKLIKMLFKKYPKITYFAILGLLIASPFSIIYALLKEYPNAFELTNVWGYIAGVLALSLGILIAGYFSLYEKKHQKRDLEIEKEQK